MPPKLDPATIRSGVESAKVWLKRMGRAASEEAVKEETKVAVKDAAAEVVKEVVKDTIADAVKSRGEKKAKVGEKKAEEVDGIRLSVKAAEDEERPKASPPETDRVAEEIKALKEFIASILAETTAKATTTHIEEGRIQSALLVFVGGVLVGGVLVGGYLLYRRRRGRAAAERCAECRGRPAPATLAAIDPISTATHLAPPSLAERYMHKNRLQTFAERMYKKSPVYKVEFESDGKSLELKFRCTVEVGGQQFSSTGSFGRKKEAEQDAARVAYEVLAAVGEDAIKEAVALIDQDVVFCKSILQEFAVKTKKKWPSYSVAYLIKPLTLYTASVEFDGTCYTGESSPNKKHAELNAARTVIKSILAEHNTCMVGIVRLKKQLITAVRSSGSASGGPDHIAPVLQKVQGGANAVPAGTSVNPSSANVGCLKSEKPKGGV